MNRQGTGQSDRVQDWVQGFKIFAGLGLVKVLNFETGRFQLVDPGSFLDKLVDTYESNIKISQWLTVHHWFS